MATRKKTKDSEGSVTVRAIRRRKVRKAADDPSAIRSNALSADDEFATFYTDGGIGTDVTALRPPYNLAQLSWLVQENNALGPCVDAMEVNIDGTGHTIKPRDSSVDLSGGNEELKKRVEEFFDEPFPGTSMVTIRRALRRDIEITGMGYLEVMRNPLGDLVFLRHVRAKDFRLVKLGDPVSVERSVRRGGKSVSFKVMVRERRYVQIVGRAKVFFKEFGASRELDKDKGEWVEDTGRKIPFEKRASELIAFGVVADIKTPYSVPRWIGQIPSVLGSRKAEEQNLEFFDSGGIPPLMVIVQGGNLAEKTVQMIETRGTGRSRDKQSMMVVESTPASQSIDKDNPVRITVERFGAERQSDSFFENYDARSEQRVRKAFRLPPIFVGLSQDYSFATAHASYTVGEAQVFRPERDEFDEVMNTKIMPELDPERVFEFSSLPLNVQDAAMQMEAIKFVKDAGAIDDEGLVEAVNETVNTELRLFEDAADGGEEEQGPSSSPVVALPAPSGAVPGEQPAPGGPAPTPTSKADVPSLMALATKACAELNMRGRRTGEGVQVMISLAEEVKALPEEERRTFDALLGVLQFRDAAWHDPDGVAELSGCSLVAMANMAA